MQTVENFFNSKIIPIIQEFRQSRNKLRVLVTYKKTIFALLFSLTAIIGLIGYTLSPDSTGLEILNNTAGLFIFAWANDESILLDIAKMMALLTMSFGAITLYLSNRADAYEVERIQENPYTLLIGLGEQNSTFINQLPKMRNDVMAIEPDSHNPHIEESKAKGVGVVVSKAEDAFEKIDFARLRECIISTGDDRRNITIGQQLMGKLDEKHQKLLVRVDNRGLSVLFKQNVIQSHNNVDIITYSLYENMTKALFAKHTVVGLRPEIAEGEESFGTVVVGSSPLAAEIIYALAMLSTLPNENPFTLHLLAPDANAFYDRVQKLFPHIEQIPHLNIVCTEVVYDSITFYQNKVWESKNLTNIIIATENEAQNLDIAINLQDITYLEESAAGSLKTKILFALYHETDIGKMIDQDKESFANFYHFADMKEACAPENLIDEQLDLLAKLIHADYTGSQSINPVILNQKWMSLSPHLKASNKAQALHIETKLVVLGLKKVASDNTLDERIAHNKAMLEKHIPPTEQNIQFPKTFDTLLSRLARAEHNRWNAFHYLHGWSHDATVDRSERDKRKKHACLLPFSKFDTKALQDTYQYDVASILKIPDYLAHAGYELKEIDNP